MRQLSFRFGQQWLSSGAYLATLVIGAQFETPKAWQFAFSLTALWALMAWQSTLRRVRAITDTPTSLIASAAQGYVELCGTGLHAFDPPVRSPLNQTICLWYRYTVEHEQQNKWVQDANGQSSASLLISDGSGHCLIDPEGAEIHATHKQTWEHQGYRYTQHLILPGEPIYVVGAFKTLNADSLALNMNQEVSELLAAWKQDMPSLKQRHDTNNNGHLDDVEWARVRAQAHQEVKTRHQHFQTLPDNHTMQSPTDGRPYLIATQAPERLAWRLRLWALLHASVFLAALMGVGYWWSK